MASWKAGSETEKRALFASCLGQDRVYSDPLTRTEGWDALLAYMVDFQRQVPGGHFVTEEFASHHGRSLARWRMMNGQNVKIGEGASYGEYDDDGRLVAMTEGGWSITPRRK